jgi:tetratricopeptide (TPR) repeat protein
MGAPFTATGQGNIATRIDVSSKLTSRVRLLSVMTIGLAYYAARNFEQSLEIFRELARDSAWESVGGKEVLHLLIGNSAGRINDLALAEQAYLEALQIDPGYSRGYAGLGNVYFIRALEPIRESEDLSKVDSELIKLSIEAYEKAKTASHQPALSDIPVKVHFGLGQAYLMRSYANENEVVEPAVREFEMVIAYYADGENPRVRELAAESHARLGLIYASMGQKKSAIQEYQMAAALLFDVPERQHLYEERAMELANGD